MHTKENTSQCSPYAYEYLPVLFFFIPHCTSPECKKGVGLLCIGVGIYEENFRHSDLKAIVPKFLKIWEVITTITSGNMIKIFINIMGGGEFFGGFGVFSQNHTVKRSMYPHSW